MYIVKAEAATRAVLRKKVFLKISQNSQKSTFARDCPQVCNFIRKETLAQVFSCEFREISKNTFFTEYFRTTAFTNVFLRTVETLFFERH